MENNSFLPPVIRVFLSSTFADMQNERNYFNTFLQPKLRAMCEERGVSFFSVDLRWGITQEDQINGKVLPICLNEIDKCRPFFIGIIGSRYGSVVHEITEDLQKSIPWVADKAGKSITELEMLYGVLDDEINKETPSCAFYLRDPKLTDELYPQSEAEPEALTRLKDTVIGSESIHHGVYRSLEEFGEMILGDFYSWLDKRYPASDVASEARIQWYNAEFSRNYIDSPKMRSFLNNYLASARKPLMITGSGKLGKTAFLTNWALDNERAILVNCRSDAAYRYWPSVAFEIVRRMQELEPDVPFPQFKALTSLIYSLFGRKDGENADADSNGDIVPKSDSKRIDTYFVSDDERKAFRESFIEWFSRFDFSQPVTIVINDLETLDDGEARFLTWLPTYLPENVRLVCSCNDPEIIDNAEVLGWNTREMPCFQKDSAGAFLEIYLKNFGKSLNEEQKEAVLSSPLANYPGYLKYIVHFLNRYSRFENLNETTSRISGTATITELYAYSFGFMLADFTEDERKEFLRLLTLLRCNSDALLEQDYYTMLSDDEVISALSWSRYRTVLELLDAVRGEYWQISDQDLCGFIDSLDINKPEASLTLGRFYLARLRDSDERSIFDKIRYCTESAKYALIHLLASEAPDALCEGLTDENVLMYLSNIDWNIVRTGFMHLVMHSDIDVPDLIEKTIDKCRSIPEKGKWICIRLARMIPDLEYRRLTAHFSQLMECEIHGELQMLNVRFSEGFVRCHMKINEQKNNGNSDNVIRLVNEALEEDVCCSDVEKTILLIMKADAESDRRLLKDALKTCAEMYFTALRTAELTLIVDALLLYATVTYFNGDYDESIKYLHRTQKLALLLGHLRAYLSALNVEGMYCYRTNQSDRSMELLQLCSDTWKKVGNIREYASVNQNISNNYASTEDYAKAISVLEDTLRVIEKEGGVRERRLIPSMKASIGNAKLKLDDPSGETMLLEVIEMLGGDSKSYSVVNCRMALADHYKAQSRFANAAKQYEAAARCYMDRREYGQAVNALSEMFFSLEAGHYNTLCDKKRREWEAEFEEIPNGPALFKKIREDGSVNDIQNSSLEERLIVARADGDQREEADILNQLFFNLYATNTAKALEYAVRAAELYLSLNENEKGTSAAEDGLYIIIRQRHPDAELYFKLLRMLPKREQEAIKLWQEMRKFSFEAPDAYEDSTFEQYRKLEEAFFFAGYDYPRLLMFVLSDQIGLMLLYCQIDAVFGILRKASEERRLQRIFYSALSNLYDKLGSYASLLRNEYETKRAECLIRMFENAIVFFQRTDNTENAAAIAGNLAIIYRRRRDEENTFRCHKLSMELYQSIDMTNDYLIEKLHLALAYTEFGMVGEAVELLRSTIKESNKEKFSILEGSAAGNLAGLLMKHPEYCTSENEILELFAVEESILYEIGERREYAISLHNQVTYILTSPDPDYGLAKEKLDKLKECVEDNELDEFRPRVRVLVNALLHPMDKKGPGGAHGMAPDRSSANKASSSENNVLQALKNAMRNKGSQSETSDDPDVVLEKILAQRPLRIDHWMERDNDSVTALCLLEEQPSVAKVNVITTLKRGGAAGSFSMRMNYVFQIKNPSRALNKSAEQYVEWWNGFSNLYELEYQKNNNVIVAYCDIPEATVPDLRSSFESLFDLCTIDMMNLSYASIGLLNIDQCILLKKNRIQ